MGQCAHSGTRSTHRAGVVNFDFENEIKLL